MHLDPTTLSPLPSAESWWPRFVEKIAVADNGCWRWTASIHPGGYGRFGIKNRVYPAHRVAYQSMRGEIPNGLCIDHICHNLDESCPGAANCLHRRCVNPWHMETVTNTVNVLRGQSRMAKHARQTHCKNGHPFSGENLHRTSDGRRCKTCSRAANRAFHARRGPIPVKPSPAQRRVMETIRSGGYLIQSSWQQFTLCAPGSGESICPVSTGTPASIVKRGWATRPEICRLELTDAGLRMLDGSA